MFQIHKDPIVNILSYGLIILVTAIFLSPSPEYVVSRRLEKVNITEYDVPYAYVGGGCLSETCVIVYVAPWCPTCRKLKPMIQALRNELMAEGIQVDVVVGNDSRSQILQYAQDFSFPVFTDVSGAFYREQDMEAVPYFVVTDQLGEIRTEYRGGYTQVGHMRQALGI